MDFLLNRAISVTLANNLQSRHLSKLVLPPPMSNIVTRGKNWQLTWHHRIQSGIAEPSVLLLTESFLQLRHNFY